MRRQQLSNCASVALVMMISLGACDRGGGSSEPVTLTVIADSIIKLVHDTAADGSVTVGCNFVLNGKVEGPPDEYAIVRRGSVQYYRWENMEPLTKYDWSPESVHRFWLDSIISTGETRRSAMHGFGQTPPPQLLRGTVTFDYASSNDDDTRTTTPWNFYCH